MKKAILILSLALISSYAISQDQYPKGCYMSFEEIKVKTPSSNCYVKIKKRSDSDIAMSGGNDYKLISLNKTMKKKVLKKDIFAYSDGDSLFINCLPYLLQIWYAKILSDGKYFVFIAGIPMDKTMQSPEMQTGMSFGAVGGAFAGASLAMQRYLYVLEKKTNQVKMIDFTLMKKILMEYPELLEKFENEKRNQLMSTQVEYLKKVNELYNIKQMEINTN